MALTDPLQLRRRVRFRYELNRVSRAFLGSTPILLVGVLAATFQPRVGVAFAFGAASFILSAVMLWYGRDPQRAVLPGALAGIVPVILTLCVNRLHECDGGSCATVCMPVSVVGGALAGLVVVSWARGRSGVSFAVSASTIALLTGAIGCSCAGHSGLLGLVLGYAVGMAPKALRVLTSKRGS